MPIPIGLLQKSINTLSKPIVIITAIYPDGYTDFGNQISIDTFVSYISPFFEFPVEINDGYISIVDSNTNEILGTNIVSSSISTISISNFDGYRLVSAFYTGVQNLYNSAISVAQPYYTVKAMVTISSNSSNNINYDSDGYVIFNFATTNIYVTLEGIVDFRLYSTNDTYVSLESSTIVADQSTVMIPANTMVPNETYYLSAIYLGSGGISSATNGLGTSGFIINSI